MHDVHILDELQSKARMGIPGCSVSDWNRPHCTDKRRFTEGCTWLKIIGRETRQSCSPRVLLWPSPEGGCGNLYLPLISTQQTWYHPVRHVCLPSAGRLLHPRFTIIHGVSCYDLLNPRNKEWGRQDVSID